METERRLIDIGDGRIIEWSEGEIDPPSPPRVKNPGSRAGKRQKTKERVRYKQPPRENWNPLGKACERIPGFREWFSRRSAQLRAVECLETKRATRFGIPDGMRRRTADELWAEARRKAKATMTALKDAGALKDADDRAEMALEAALEVMHSPLNQQTKLAAARLVLEWTKAKPAAKQEVTVNAAEAWLAQLAEGGDDK